MTPTTEGNTEGLPDLPKLPESTWHPAPHERAFSPGEVQAYATAHGLACYEAGRASHAAPTVPVDAVVGEPVAEEAEPDPYFGVQDEVALTRAVCVMDDVLTDIEGWEDQALANVVKDSRIDLCAMIEVIRMRADSSYVCGSKPIDGNYGSPLAASMASRAQTEPEGWRELLETFTTWARQVAARVDVPRGIRSAAANLHDDGKRRLATLGETK